jgi:hypothetical protein
MSRNLGALTLLDPSGPAWPVMGVLLHKNGVKSFKLLWRHDPEEQDLHLHRCGNFQSSLILSLFKILCVE